MRASDLVSGISDLIAKHGDLEIYCNCDYELTELAFVALFHDPHSQLPIFVIDSASNKPLRLS